MFYTSLIFQFTSTTPGQTLVWGDVDTEAIGDEVLKILRPKHHLLHDVTFLHRCVRDAAAVLQQQQLLQIRFTNFSPYLFNWKLSYTLIIFGNVSKDGRTV